ncbi:MAG: FAD binding domain-containing protein [Actinomycetota bacterium]|nr:FAD binding domain-containing protein [Actinomycetota bacterium]MDH5224168.1 FAD binding domain-containing protein [Actinomycetota bacterium]MDH5313115.1 FAD binding domain-containing protein [Actinomycetota bacterium]
MTRSFTSATTVDEALEAIVAGARPVAGGTDLVVGARQGKAPLPEAVVAIDRIDALRALDDHEGGLQLGALATHEAIEHSEIVRSRFTALADASAIVGSHATRANGTIGGNVMNASPAMDTGGPLLCFGAMATLRSAAGERTVSLDDLWTGPGATSASDEELLLRLDVPAPLPGTGSAYVRLEYRRQMEIAVVGATAVIRIEGGSVADARIAITALAPTIRRIDDAERALIGSDGDAEAVGAAARAVAAGSAPIGDVRASAGYRSAMAEVVARRAIVGALTRARGDEIRIPASDALYGA